MRPASVARVALMAAGGLSLVAGLAVAGVFIRTGWYGLNTMLRTPMIWVAVAPDDPRLSRSIRLALQQTPPVATAGTFAWTKRADGLESGELPAVVGDDEVDRVLLARLDPRKYRFQTRNRPSGDWDLADWMRALGATVVINGSYFDRYGAPATPFLELGVRSGPRDYRATHGAFVVSNNFAGVRD